MGAIVQVDDKNGSNNERINGLRELLGRDVEVRKAVI